MTQYAASQPSLRRIVSRLCMHQRLLRYLVDAYIRDAKGQPFDPRIAGIIDMLMSQQARDIESVQKELGSALRDI